MSKCSNIIIYHQIYLQYHPDVYEIPTGYVIHHIDFNHYNDGPDNLQMMTISEHIALHNHYKNRSKEKNGMYGKKHTEESIELIRQNRKGKGIEKISGDKNYHYIKRNDEMIKDVKNHISCKLFMEKYKCSHNIYYDVKNNYLG